MKRSWNDMNLIPNISPKAFSSSAVIVGYLLIDDLTANEQNALGNWLMLTAQVICTNAFYKQVQQERGIITSTRKSADKTTQNNHSEFRTEDEIAMLKKMVNALNQEINNLKSSL